jgi:hypothetical protein
MLGYRAQQVFTLSLKTNCEWVRNAFVRIAELVQNLKEDRIGYRMNQLCKGTKEDSYDQATLHT